MSHVEVTGWGRYRDGHGLKTLKVLYLINPLFLGHTHISKTRLSDPSAFDIPNQQFTLIPNLLLELYTLFKNLKNKRSYLHIHFFLKALKLKRGKNAKITVVTLL